MIGNVQIMSITNNQQKIPSWISFLIRSSMGTDVVISISNPVGAIKSYIVSVYMTYQTGVYLPPVQCVQAHAQGHWPLGM